MRWKSSKTKRERQNSHVTVFLVVYLLFVLASYIVFLLFVRLFALMSIHLHSHFKTHLGHKIVFHFPLDQKKRSFDGLLYPWCYSRYSLSHVIIDSLCRCYRLRLLDEGYHRSCAADSYLSCAQVRIHG